MSDNEYRQAHKMAKRLAGHAAGQVDSHPERAAVLAATAQVHATLALAAATRISSGRIEHDQDDE